MSDRIVLDGTCVLADIIDGDCDLTDTIDGTAEEVIVVRDVNYYTGEMEFVPRSQAQIIECEQLTMPSNIIIKPVPNNYGLITWNGTTLTVS